MTDVDTAVFAGGCFWCTEAVFKAVPGVKKVMPGYTGGSLPNPTYEKVSAGTTGHVEAVKVEFDPKQISFRDLLQIFFETHDPTQVDRQGNDIGPQYRSAIFYTTLKQKEQAEQMLTELDNSGRFEKPVATHARLLENFYDAEANHRDFYLNNKQHPYCQLVISPKLEKIRAMRLGKTEAPFSGKYTNEKRPGMYCCANCGTELFSSDAKFNSGTGWPSFTEPANRANVELKEDQSLGLKRTEVKCKHCGAHLGHVFDDGPGPDSKRYCINSVCLDLKVK